MNRMSTYVALALGGGALLALLGEYSISTYAYAQMPTGTLPQVGKSELLLAASPSSSVTTPTIPLGVAQQLTILKQRADADEADIATLKSKVAVDDKDIKTLQSQVSTLQSQVSTLQGGVQGQQASLSALWTQFLKHTHQYVVHAYSLGVETILTCPNGYGNPCVSGVGDKDITVVVPGGTPGHDVTLTTSAPQ